MASLDILKILDRISSSQNVHFQWVPSHEGIDGNVKTDFLARTAAEEGVSPNGSPLPEPQAAFLSKFSE
ncbi:hypothetical protein TNCV_763411 [Trichonephila clavipes]|nr:hypothetical protein TNCV_763411 [Trichonephila clavipes]